MRKFYTLLWREVRSYFHSPIAYIVLTFFLIVSGINFNLIVSYMNRRTIDISVQQFFLDRKSTRLNSSHVEISYAVFCLKKKKKIINTIIYKIQIDLKIITHVS